MPSWIMHVWVAEGVRDAFPQLDRGQLLLGAIAPDAALDKAESHLKGERFTLSDGAPLGVGRFIRAHGDRVRDRDPLVAAFYAGYLTHLAADDLMFGWLHFAALKPKMNRDPRGWDALHDDYRSLNGVVAANLRDRAGAAAALARAGVDTALGCPLLKEAVIGDVAGETLRHLEAPAKSPALRVLDVDGVWAYLERATARAQDWLWPFIR